MNTMTYTSDLTTMEIVSLLAHEHMRNDEPSQDKLPCSVLPVAFNEGGHPVYDNSDTFIGMDIYDVLGQVEPSDSVNFYSVRTSGWAAPIDSLDGSAPSQHPDRKRVNLMIVVGRDGSQASALRMQGNDELILDDGQATGALQEAIARIFR